MWLFGRKKKTTKWVDWLESYEEISEKKTSKLWYILLFFMTILLVYIGELMFADISSMVDRPDRPSYCRWVTMSDLESMKSDSCGNSFNGIDESSWLSTAYNQLRPRLKQVMSYNREIDNHKDAIRSQEGSNKQIQERYDLALQESIANEPWTKSTKSLRDQLDVWEKRIVTKQEEIMKVEVKRSILIDQLRPEISALSAAYNKAQRIYERQSAIADIKVFMLMLLFAGPLFLVAVRFYMKHKKRNSPYTIIFTAIVTAASILLLHVLWMLIWVILPIGLIGRFFLAIYHLPFMHFILRYGAIFAVIWLFGWIVYKMQKSVYASWKVAIRRIKNNKCPWCAYRLDISDGYCPNCGIQLQKECLSCNKQRYVHLRHCSHCGEK